MHKYVEHLTVLVFCM